MWLFMPNIVARGPLAGACKIIWRQRDQVRERAIWKRQQQRGSSSSSSSSSEALKR